MDIDWNEIIKYTLPIIAILISAISATITWRNTQKQIRVNKIEEIVLDHRSRINWRRDKLNRYFQSVNFSFFISKNDVRKLLHKIK